MTENKDNRSSVGLPSREAVNEGSDPGHETAMTAGRSPAEVNTDGCRNGSDTTVTDKDSMGAIAGYIDGQPGWSPRPKRAVRRPARYCE